MTLVAEVIAIGDELVHGAILDTNSRHVVRELESLGLAARRIAAVGDDPDDLAAAIRESCARADVVVATGGLGPTRDDRTREAVAAVLGSELHFHAESWERIRSWLESRGRTVPESNRSQAMLPEAARALPNDSGTAPGFVVEVGSARLYVLPGVPHEMRIMLRDRVLPDVAALPGLRPTAQQRLWVLGPSEALLGERLAPYMAAGRNPAVGITARRGLLSVRIVAAADSTVAAEALCEETALELRPLLGDWLIAEGDVELPALVLEGLRARSETLAVAESCTGGELASSLVAIPGASDTFLGGVVAYADEAKRGLLGVPAELLDRYGAVSEPVAVAMADGARKRFGADVAISTTGIAGPGGGAPDKPVGTVCFALSRASGCRSWTLRIPDLGRAFVRARAVSECFRGLLP